MTIVDDFIADARKVPLEDALAIVGGVRRKPNISGEEVGPCPCCFGGGKDRFSLNVAKQVWSCRHYDRQGGDALELIAHKEGLDLRRRAEFLLACSIVQGKRPIPEGGERETEEERVAREARNEALRAASKAKRARDADKGERERQKAISQGRGIYLSGMVGTGTAAETYLMRRTGAARLPLALWENLRFVPALTYWHGRDERGNARDVHCGPALVAPMVDLSGQIVGCHQTWIDLDMGPKFRPVLLEVKDDGACERLPTKKMRGHKRASILPVYGDLDATRWVCGEGIETVLAVAGGERFRADTFYFATGDIGNMAGPCAGTVAHPTDRKQDSKGRWKPVMIAGPVPRPGSEEDCFQVPEHVRALTLLADGDSEPAFTIAAMDRAVARLSRPGLAIAVEWPPHGFGDFADFFASTMTETAA